MTAPSDGARVRLVVRLAAMWVMRLFAGVAVFAVGLCLWVFWAEGVYLEHKLLESRAGELRVRDILERAANALTNGSYTCTVGDIAAVCDVVGEGTGQRFRWQVTNHEFLPQNERTLSLYPPGTFSFPASRHWYPAVESQWSGLR